RGPGPVDCRRWTILPALSRLAGFPGRIGPMLFKAMIRMPGRLKAGLLGAGLGAIIIVLVELLAVVVNDEKFFGTQQSWIILAIAVIVCMWVQLRAYDQQKGRYASKDDDPKRVPKDYRMVSDQTDCRPGRAGATRRAYQTGVPA